MSKIPGRLITYCTNIHPGESWEETFAALKRHIPLVKAAVSPDHSFPIGLRLSNLASKELTVENNRAFTAWLNDQDCFVPTINGFPYGSFHGECIKERVYLPDWRSRKRADYTIRLADLLAGWLPDSASGSISTVPVGFRTVAGVEEYPEIRRQLKAVLTHLRRILDEHGKMIVLALEPEPGCLLETTEEICRFYDTMGFHHSLKNHLAICYDCCHQAVEFEEPAGSLARLAAAGIPIAKIQVSSGVRINGENSAELAGFNESCYLHQVVVRRTNGVLFRYPDLPDALSGHERHTGDEWRCHFHVPIFHSNSGMTGTTRSFLDEILPLLPKEMLLEVETYTWDVLPAELRGVNVTDSIIREIRWLKERLHA